MKKVSKGFVIAALALAVSNASNAQATVSATATSTATIVTPLAIANAADMNFGNVAVGSGSGTVVLSPAGSRSTTGGVTLPSTQGTVAAASFDVTGEGSYTYAITLPASVTLTRNAPGASETMTVNTFTSTPSGTGALTAGAQNLRVGATLNVGASQVAGTYESLTPFTVSVVYN
jgi:hypothetical protein